jgi:hypothetical protein
LARKVCNGKKTIYAIEFTNKDPSVIKIFLRFLREVLKVEEDRLHGELFVYPDLKKKALEEYWSTVTGIPLSRFNKTIVLKQKNKKYIPNLLGTFKVRYSSKSDYLKLANMMEIIFPKQA